MISLLSGDEELAFVLVLLYRLLTKQSSTSPFLFPPSVFSVGPNKEGMSFSPSSSSPPPTTAALYISINSSPSISASNRASSDEGGAIDSTDDSTRDHSAEAPIVVISVIMPVQEMPYKAIVYVLCF